MGNRRLFRKFAVEPGEIFAAVIQMTLESQS